MKLSRGILSAGILAALAGAVILAPTIRGGAAEPAAYVGSEVCQGCHTDLGKDMLHMKVLAVSKSDSQKGCESCHGPGSLHPMDPDHKQIINPKKLTSDQVAAVCLKCHKKFNMAEWKSGQHSREKLSCTECHNVHQPGMDSLLREKQPELCYKCHRNVKGELNLTSHHPVREGRVICSDCHNPHSGRNGGMLTKPDASALCVTCHSDKRGPFKYEHDPMVSGMSDGCLTCHKAHGSANQHLMKVVSRGVCIQCHVGVVRPGGSHDGFFPAAFGGAECTQCHEKIHGSNRSQLFFR